MTLTHTTNPAYAAAPVLEPPFAKASDLGSPIQRPDPTVAITMAQGDFSPPQLDA